MASNGQRGADFERRCRDALVDLGYVVVRSTASKTPMDLAAFRCAEGLTNPLLAEWRLDTLLVQCKVNGRLDHGEWNVLFDLALSSGNTPVLARREKIGRRYAPAFYLLTDYKSPRQRKPPMVRLFSQEAADAEQ